MIGSETLTKQIAAYLVRADYETLSTQNLENHY